MNELVRKARGAEVPQSFWTDPLMYQGGSDGFIGPNDDIEAEDEAWGIDFEAEIAAITDDFTRHMQELLDKIATLHKDRPGID